MELKNSVIAITGAGQGLGQSMAISLAQAGSHLALIDLNSQGLEETLRACTDFDTNIKLYCADVTDEQDVEATFERIVDDFGQLNGLVNNAGVHGPRIRVDALETSDVERVLAVNVTALFQCSRVAIRRMSTHNGGKGGAIVNVSSGSANLGAPGAGVLYAASKGAVNSLTIGLSQEVAGEGIRVNAVAPGLTVTDMPPVEKLDRDGPNVPIGRAAQPEEIAEAIYWLLTDKASYVAGANLRVGGGRI